MGRRGLGTRGPRDLSSAAALVVGVAAALVVVVPLARMVRTAWSEGAGQLGEVLSRPGLGTAVLHSLLLALVVTVVAVPLGAALALGLRRADVPGRRALRLGVLLPVLVPDFVLAYSWLRAYGGAGFTDDLVGVAWSGIQGPVGVAVVVTVNAVPLTYLVTAAGLAARSEPAAERAARVSGAGAGTVLRTITLPLLGPALAAAAVLVFVLTLGTFAIPEVMGSPAGFATITTRIYANLSRSSDPAAFVEALLLALLLVVIAITVVAPADQVLGPRLRATRTAATDAAPGSRRTTGPGRWIAAAVTCYLLLTVGLPLLGLLATAVTRAVGLPPTPGNWTFDNFDAVLTTRNEQALGRSLVLALSAASILVVLGGCVAALERTRAGRASGSLVMLTFVLPGSTLAVGLLITYGRWLGDTVLIILLAYVAKLWALAHRPIAGAVDRLPPDEVRAARMSGAPAVVALRTVVLRPLAPALAAAWTVCFLTALHEVTMSSLLYGPGNETLAVVVLNSAELGQVGRTAALSVLVTLAVLVPAGVCWLTVRHVQPRRATPRGGAGG